MSQLIHRITIRQFMAGKVSHVVLKEEIERTFRFIRAKRASLFSPQNRDWTIRAARQSFEAHGISLSNDHAGRHAAEFVDKVLHELNVPIVRNFGPAVDFEGPLNFPIWVVPALEALNDGNATRAILCCGSGTGVSIVANKTFPHRAIKAVHPKDVVRGREHNDVNVLTVGEMMIADREVKIRDVIQSIILFLSTPFIVDPSRYDDRIGQIDHIQALSVQAGCLGVPLTGLPEFEKAVANCPELADMLPVKAFEAISRGDFVLAIQFIEKYLRLGTASKNYTKFLTSLQNILSQCPAQEEITRTLGRIGRVLG